MQTGKNEIHVYKSDLSKTASQISECIAILSPEEKERAEKFKLEIHRNRFIAARAVLRKLLSEYVNTEPSQIYFSYSAKGKPYLTGKEIEFNVAHSGDVAVYAFSRFEVGIDIEQIRQMDDAMRIARRHFSGKEIEELESLSADEISEAFFNCWTGKEAFVKALGEGISYPLSDFAVTLKAASEPAVSWTKQENESLDWKLFRFIPESGYVSSVAARNKEAFLVMQD